MRRSSVSLLVAAALLAGCGSDDDSSGPSRANYISQVDAICAQTIADLAETNRRLQELSRSSTRLSQFAEDLEDGNRIARDELADIRAVPPPDGAADEMKAVTDARSRQLDLIDQLTGAARANNAGRFRALSDAVQRAKQRAQAAAKDFGFKICGTG